MHFIATRILSLKNNVNNNNNEMAQVLISRLVYAGSEFKLAMVNVLLWPHHQVMSCYAIGNMCIIKIQSMSSIILSND